MRLVAGLLVGSGVMLVLSLPSWIAPVTRYGAVLAGALVAGASVGAYHGRGWKWLLGGMAGLLLAVLISGIAWAVLVPGHNLFPWVEQARDVVARSTSLLVVQALQREWLLDRSGDHFAYLTFGVTNMALGLGAGLLGGLLASGRRAIPPGDPNSAIPAG